MSFSAVILAGGRSSRMGRDKAWIEIGGQTLLARQIGLIRETGAAEVFISGREGVDYSPFGCRVLKDTFQDSGPLAGIECALGTISTSLLLVLAVDLPEMTAAFLRGLFSRCANGAGIIPRVTGRIEPLAAFYPKAAKSLAEVRLREGNNGVADFAEICVRSGIARFVDHTASEKKYFVNWNSPADICIGENENMKINPLKVFCFGLVFLVVANLWAGEAIVFAAASLTDSLKEIAATYESNSNDHIVFNFGASSTLARQIEAGAPADIFFSADEAKMNGLDKRGLIDSSTRVSRLGNTLVVVVSVDSPMIIHSAGDLTNTGLGKIALADPKAVPAGVYAKTWLDKQQLWLAIAPKVVPTENVRAALAAVESGNVDAGVVYKTDAGISRKVKIAYQVPMRDTPDISYPMALVKESKDPEAARQFLKYLDSGNAAKVFEKFGFSVRDK